MNNDQITSLAREYAEFTDLSPVDKKNISAICENFLKFTLRRYCLVEKSKVEKEYHEANICRTHVERYGAQWGALTAKMAFMERIFPDLTWDSDPEEVEIIINRKKNG